MQLAPSFSGHCQRSPRIYLRTEAWLAESLRRRAARRGASDCTALDEPLELVERFRSGGKVELRLVADFLTSARRACSKNTDLDV